jgi:hypothetical protein
MRGTTSSDQVDWAARNRRVLQVFAPVLLLTAVLGFVLPPDLSLMSGAVPYDVFHLLSGVVGLLVLVSRWRRAPASFNLVFGAIDLWQAVAGVTGLFPAQWFALRPADHVVHLLIGAALVTVGYLGRATDR